MLILEQSTLGALPFMWAADEVGGLFREHAGAKSAHRLRFTHSATA
jgi:hypothetical protein